MARRKIVRKKKIYDVDWYLRGTDYCYRTTINVTWEQVKAIAEDKMADLNCFTVESAMKLVAGTARSMGISVKGDFPGE